MDDSSLLGGQRASRRLSGQASQQLAVGLSLLAVACAVGSASGYASGWTRYHSESFSWPELHRESPITLDIRQGWWESRTTWGITRFAPTLFKIDGQVVRPFGALAAGALVVSIVCSIWALFVSSAVLLDLHYSRQPTVKAMRRMALITSLMLYAAVITLYAALAISLRHQTKQQLEVAVVPRPDWACGLGILAGITWTLLTAVYSGIQVECT
ncbi:hypothetical protein WJX74_005681 [Apatococcus lobatus]|uniref:Uncharacterized protein n=1 Tax=Apatococcus lobatus TaxID=904363 RepID=A0AAW1Q943_9CHLO